MPISSPQMTRMFGLSVLAMLVLLLLAGCAVLVGGEVFFVERLAMRFSSAQPAATRSRAPYGSSCHGQSSCACAFDTPRTAVAAGSPGCVLERRGAGGAASRCGQRQHWQRPTRMG